MAGVSDKPYRRVCRQHGADLVVSEMITSRKDLRHSSKTRLRSDFNGEPGPVVVQLVGTDPHRIAQAAQYNVGLGAQIIDINMGCPAKKVCKKAAGSALLANPALVEQILTRTVASVPVPVTLKIRTGSKPTERNGVEIARIAEQSGIQSLVVHGRTRQCRFVGAVEYDTIARIKQAVSIPVIANGDIDSAQKARAVLEQTKADGVMIGRAAQGQPWLFAQIGTYLREGKIPAMPPRQQRISGILRHISEVHDFYGSRLGVKLARKHIKWYLHHWDHPVCEQIRGAINETVEPAQQIELLQQLLHGQILGQAA